MTEKSNDLSALFDMTADEFIGFVVKVHDQAEEVLDGPAEAIIANRECWNLKDDDGFGYTTKAMSEEELQQAIVEDLLLIVQFRSEGKECGGDFVHLTRFLDQFSRDRVAAQLESPMVKSLTMRGLNGEIELNPEYLQDAMDFSGVWIEGFEPLAGETSLAVNSQFGK